MKKLITGTITAIAAIGLALLPLTAQAAVIPVGITSVTETTTGPVAQGSSVGFAGAWAVPDGSLPGDSFTLQLPAQLAWAGATAFNLTAPDGSIVATANVSATGLVTFVLSSYVTTHPTDVNGTFKFTTDYSATQTQAGPQTLDFKVGATVVPVTVTDAGPCTGTCAAGKPVGVPFKYMGWTNAAQTRTSSTLAAHVTSAATNAITFTDTPANGLALDCSTISYAVGTNTDQNANLIAPFATAAQAGSLIPSCSASKLVYSWTGVAANETVELHIQSIVTVPGLASYANAGDITINGVDKPVSANVVSSSASGSGSGSTPPPVVVTPPPVVVTPTPTPTESSTPVVPVVPPAKATPVPTPVTVAPVTVQKPVATGKLLAYTGDSSASIAATDRLHGIETGLAVVLLLVGGVLTFAKRRKEV